MSWLSAEMLLDLSRSVAGAAVNWWLQSALLIAAGLAVGALCRNRGSAVQSAVYRTTLAAVIGAPLATWGLHRAGVSGWSVEMPAAWSLVDAAPLSGGAAVEKSSPAEESALDVAARAALNVSAEDATETIHPYPIDADVPAGRSVDVVMNAPPDAPAPLRPSLAAPAPLAQAPVEATPAVLTMHRFGAIAVAASAAWLFVSAVLVVRLAVAWQRLGRIRRHAAPADPEVQSACRELASQLRVAPPAVLRSPYLPSPCLTGLRRPAVLLPEAAGDLPVRDVLAHELAHLSRGDCHWNLARQLAGAVLFFQPLMWRLSRRIETTAEEVCDDFVVHLGGDRRDYAYRLCDIAELSLAPFAPAGVGIVSLRSMLSQRVARIMDTSRSLSTRVGGALLTVVLLGGLIGAFAAGLVGLSGAASAVTANENDGEENSSNGDEGATATDDDLITVRGQVLDPAGKPVPDADVHVLRWYWNFGDHAPLATTNADANGRFEISYRKSQFAENAGRPNQWRETYFASFVDGFGPGWASYDRLKPGEEAVIKLAVDDVPIEGRVIDLEGNPVAGATIEVGNVAEPKSGSLDGYVAAITSGQAISTAYAHIDESLPDSDVGSWPKVQTDADGRFRLTGFGRERRITLQVSGPTIVTDNINAATRVMEPIVHPAFDYEDADDTTQYGAQFEYTAAPSRAIEGVVRDAESGETLAGVEIWSLKFAGADISGITTVRTKSGADGYFRLEGMPKGEGNRVIVVPTGQPYFNAEFDVPNPAGTDPAPLDVELHRGVWVTGRVADKATGKPVSAHIHYITFPDNERAQGLKEFEYGRHGMGVQDMFRTDADGRYRVVALPGHGIIGVRTVLTPYPGGQGYHDIEGVEDRESFRKFNGVFSPTEKFPTAVKEIQVDKDAAENVCDFDLDPGGRMTIRAVDPEGKPLVGVQVTGVSEIDGNMERMDSAEFDLVSFRPGENRTVLLSHPDRRLGKSLRVTYDPASKEPLTIALEPLGVVMGRLVNDGEPVSGATLNFRVAGDNDYGRALRGGATDADGRFRQDAILPGLKYTIYAEGAGMKFVMVAKELEVAAGETVDLGTIDLANDERPEPMHSGGVGAAAPKEPVEGTLVNDSPVANHEVSTQPLSYSGRVETPQGEPIAGAKIWLAVTSHKYVSESNRENGEGLLRELGAADEQGRFQIVLDAATTQEIRKRLHFSQVQLAATAEGRGLDWLPLDVFEDNPAPSEMRDMLQARIDQALGDGRFASRALKLRPESQPVRGRLVDLEGRRLPNVTVLVESLRQPDVPRLLKAFEMSWKREMNEAFDATSVGGLARSELQKLIPPVTTDDNGEFELRGIGDDQLVTLVFDADRVEARPLYVLGREMETVSLPHIESYLGGAKDVFVGRDFTFAVGPSVPVEGVVTDYDTGEPVAGVLVYVERLFKKEGVENVQLRLDTHHMRAVTDGRGRFRINGMPPGEGHVVEFLPPRSEPYFPVLQDVSLSLNDGDAKRIEIQVKRGIWIEGRVTDKQSGEPILATVDYLALRKNPHSLDKLGLDLAWVEKRYGTDSDGRYRVLGLPGPGVLLVTSQVSGYPLAAGAETIDGYDASGGVIPTTPFPLRLQVSDWRLVNQIDPAADAISFTRDLVLDAGVSIPGRVVGPRGRPISDLYVLGQAERDEYWRPKYQDNVPTTDRFTVYDYDGKGPRQLFFKNQDETLVGQYRLEGDAPEEIEVTLQSSVRVTGRLIENETDLPAARYFVLCETCSLFNEKSPPVKFRIHWRHTDDEGRFEIKGLMAGLVYKMNALNESNFADDRNRFTIDLTAAQPGDVIELGDVTGRDSDGEAFAAAAEDPATPAAAAVAAEVPAASVVRGRVLGPDGQPAAGADVAVTAKRNQPRRGGDLESNGEVLAEDKTNAEGEFVMSLRDATSKTHQYPMLIVRSRGAALAWRKLDLDAVETDATFELAAEAPIALRLVDIEGQPAAGVRVRVDAVMKRSLLSQLLGGDGVGYRGGSEAPEAWIAPVVADAQGRIEIPHLAEDFGVSLQVEGDERFAPQDIALNTGMAEQRGERDSTYRSLVANNVGADGTAVLPLAPAQLFTGTVSYEDTGAPAPQARLTVWASQQEMGSMTSVAGQADDAGRYRISPNPGIRFGVNAYPPDGSPYLVRSVEPIAWQGGDKSREVNVKLPRGVMVQGLVVDAENKRPVAGASVQYLPEGENNPYDRDDIVTGWQVMQVTDAQGRFQLVVLPGPGRILVHGPDFEYVLHQVSARELYRGKPGGERNYASAIERIDPQVGDNPLQMTIEIERGDSIEGELVDPEGKSIDQAVMITRLTIRPFWLSWHGQPVDIAGGRFTVTGLPADEEVPVHFLDPRRKLGATLQARAGMAPQRVELQPCGKAAMRFVDDDGKPIEGYEPQIEIVVTPGAHKFSDMARGSDTLAADADFISNADRLNHPGYVKSDASGRMEVAALIPGCAYRIVSYREGKFEVAKDFVAEADTTVDLGDLVVQRQDQ